MVPRVPYRPVLELKVEEVTSPRAYVLSFRASNQAGDMMTFTTRHHSTYYMSNARRAKWLYLETDRFSGVRDSRRIHGDIETDIVANYVRVARLILPKNNSIWSIPRDHFVQRTFFPKIRREVTISPSGLSIENDLPPPPENMEDMILHYCTFGSISRSGEDDLLLKLMV